MKPYQEMMIADGLPVIFCTMTAAQRKKIWDKCPPKQVPWDTVEARERRKREELLALAAEKLKATEARTKVVKPKAKTFAAQDLTNKRWDTRRGRWVEDKLAHLCSVARPTAEAPRPAVEGSAFELDARIQVLKQAPRAVGTGAAERYAAMTKYLSKHPQATIGEIMSKTTYRKDDYVWDLRHGNIK